MEKKINIAKLLQDCPKGMELDCTIWDNVVFDHVDMKSNYPIRIKKLGGVIENLTEDGHFNFDLGAKCVIFPKGKTTWDGFQRPFKAGEVLITDSGAICIYKSIHKTYVGKNFIDFYCGYRPYDNQLVIKDRNDAHFGFVSEAKLATEDEKKKLFTAIKAKGYQWNAETKKLERSIDLKIEECDETKIVSIDETQGKVGSKFNIKDLKPFDKVLLRNYEHEKWTAGLLSFYHDDEERYPYEVVGTTNYMYAIPYEGNEHLLGTTEDCDEYFKTWED